MGSTLLATAKYKAEKPIKLIANIVSDKGSIASGKLIRRWSILFLSKIAEVIFSRFLISAEENFDSSERK